MTMLSLDLILLRHDIFFWFIEVPRLKLSRMWWDTDTQNLNASVPHAMLFGPSQLR